MIQIVWAACVMFCRLIYLFIHWCVYSWFTPFIIWACSTLHCLFVSSLIRIFDKIYFLLFDLLLQSSWNAPAIHVRMVAHVTIRGRDSIHAVIHKGTVGITAKRVRKIKSPLGRMRWEELKMVIDSQAYIFTL